MAEPLPFFSIINMILPFSTHLLISFLRFHLLDRDVVIDPHQLGLDLLCILKCRPPDNRNPLSSEISSCIGSLDIQIKIVNPKVIGTLGNFSTSYIFEKFNVPPAKISSVAGKVIDVTTPFGPKKVVPVFHPAVATYNVYKTELLIEHFQAFKPFCHNTNVAHPENAA